MQTQPPSHLATTIASRHAHQKVGVTTVKLTNQTNTCKLHENLMIVGVPSIIAVLCVHPHTHTHTRSPLSPDSPDFSAARTQHPSVSNIAAGCIHSHPWWRRSPALPTSPLANFSANFSGNVLTRNARCVHDRRRQPQPCLSLNSPNPHQTQCVHNITPAEGRPLKARTRRRFVSRHKVGVLQSTN
jgi:hypothetical protein